MSMQWARAATCCGAISILTACGGVSAPAPQVGEAIRVIPLSEGESRGQFREGDETRAGGAHLHRYVTTLQQGLLYRVTMRSEEVDPTLEFTGPEGFRIDNDDAFPGTLASMLYFVAPASGRYELHASTIGAATGDYTLIFEMAVGGEADLLGLDADAERRLAGPDGPGLITDMLYFEGGAGSTVRLRVNSEAFDTIATIMAPDGQRWSNDDASDTGADGDERPTDSTLVVSLPVSGTYSVVVSPYQQSGGGEYRVRTSVRGPVMIAPGGRAPQALSGPEAQGRVLGLFAGISDYEGTGSDLYGCADDASLLADAFRESHLQNPEQQQILRDAEVTTDAFMRGIAQLAENAQPNDVVIVFYSGHGAQQASKTEDGVELDGMDETLALFDGSVTDNDVVEALSQIQAETVILALDSCHAGGFADDWARAPGRIGLYASHEDVLSNTAEPRRAGGYLSFHLREAIRGRADYRPRDGVLQSGELSDYIYEGFLVDHRRMNPPRSTDPMQRFVVRRSGVPYGEALWTYPRREDLSLPEVPAEPLMSAPAGPNPEPLVPVSECR